MATEAQINANRANAQRSTGPVTPEGRATVSGNSIEHGLFAKRDFVRPEEYDLYNAIAAALKDELDPGSLLESIHFAEALTATWRLHRCAGLEADLADKAGPDPMLDPEHHKLQQSIDRARAQSHNLLLKATKEIARLKKNRPRQAEPEPWHENTEQTQSAPREPEEPAEEFLPYGEDPIDFEIQAALAALQASAVTEQTQSAPRNTPRNAHCPCNSGKKFKRCCGFDPNGHLAQAA